MRDNLQFLNVFEAVRATVSLQHLLGAQQEFTQVTFRPANVVDPWPNKGVFVYIYIYTSSTAQGGGGSFKNRKPIGEVGCCESGMAERSH